MHTCCTSDHQLTGTTYIQLLAVHVGTCMSTGTRGTYVTIKGCHKKDVGETQTQQGVATCRYSCRMATAMAVVS